MSLEDRIRKPVDVPWLRTLLMGLPKSGKTTLIGTSTMKTLVLDFEGGGDAVLPVKPNIDIITIKSVLEFNEIYEELKTDTRGYELLVIDSISEVNESFFLELLESEADRHTRRDENRAEIQDYNYIQNQMRRMINGFKDLPMHLILTAHPTSVVMPELGSVYVPKMFPSKMPITLLGMMNEVVYLARDANDKRFLLLRGYPEYSVECRLRAGMEIPESIEDPTMDTYFQALRGEYTGKTSPSFSRKEEKESNEKKGK